MRPVLPRISSAMSGFFFCGIIELPVAYESCNVTKPNSSVAHSTISSPMRDRCTLRSAKSNSASATKSRSLTASSEFSNRRANPRSSATPSGSSGSDEPASAPAPSGDTSRRGARGEDAIDVAAESPPVREQVVRQQHRLGPLHVRVAGKVRRAGLDGAIEQHVLQRDDGPSDVAELALHVQAQRGGHLVVAAAPGVELGARRPGQLGHAPLDGGVDVFVGGFERELALFQLGLDLLERVEHRGGLLGGEDAGAHEPAHVRPRARHVVSSQAMVERQALRERQQLVGRALLEAPVPQRPATGGHRSLTRDSPAWRPTSAGRGPTGERSRRSPRGGTRRRRRTWPGRSRRGCARCAGR